MRRILGYILVTGVVLAALIFLISSNKNHEKKPIISERPRAVLGTTEIDIEIANTVEARERGLSGRESLDKDKGMLFAFKETGIYCFWMRGMQFSIDIIWLRDDGTVSQLAENVQPVDIPEPICPKEEGRYTLEVAAGVARESTVQVGSVIQIIK